MRVRDRPVPSAWSSVAEKSEPAAVAHSSR
jgi:hypothetical protein